MDVAHITPVWTETPMVDPRPCTAKVQARSVEAGGGLEVLIGIQAKESGKTKRIIIPFAVRVGTPVKASPDASDPTMLCWGLRRLGPSVWTVEPSVVTPFGFHAFVTICEVPEPAPFVEKKEG